MADAPTTRASLLARLADPADGGGWAEFVARYAPPVYAFARARGLQDADAEDLAQDVLVAVHRALRTGLYDPCRPFRRWLFEVVRNKLFDAAKRDRRRRTTVGDSDAFASLPDAADGPAEHWERIWEREWERAAFRRAATAVRDRFADTTWQAFERFAVEGQPGKAVAAELGLSVAAVYLAADRVLKAIRAEVTTTAEDDA